MSGLSYKVSIFSQYFWSENTSQYHYTMASPVCLLKRARVSCWDAQWIEHGEENMEAYSCVEKSSTFNSVDRTFCTIKQLPILKLMDDIEVVEQYVKVLLACWNTRAPISEH